MIDTITIKDINIGRNLQDGYIYTKLEGFGTPEIRVDIKDNGNFIGAKLGTYNYGRRLMQIEGKIVATSRADYEQKRRDLQDALDLIDGLTKIFITTVGGLVVETEIILNQKPVIDYISGDAIMSDFRIELVAPQPFFLKSNQTLVNLNTYSGGGGEVPASIPFSLANGANGITTCENNGNSKAYPKIFLYGGMTNPVITNSTNGKSLTLTQVLGAEDYVEIDIIKHTAVLNGTQNVFKYISGDWWLLDKGQNTLMLNATTPDGTAKAVILFNDTYIGL